MAEKKLTRALIKKIVDGMNARDMIEGVPETEDGLQRSGKKFVGALFDAAAERMGYGEKALDRVGISDAQYLSELLAGALNSSGPKSGSTEGLPTSAATGDSAQS